MTGAHRPSPLSTWSKSRYARISRLLDESLGLSPPARAAWLEALQRQDPGLAADLRNLLEPVAGRAVGVLAAAENLADRLVLPAAGQNLVGRLFGPYCVRALLGHGGMGSVWLAERVDGLFTRRVALKLVHPALMGLGLAERLSRERTILASLDHPNIARLYDAGVADDGQPYLALEYVPGTPFGVHCDRRQLGVRERLLLFRQVLAAVQYAHAHLVIHRDLKPSNILVTDEGRVCLLDFGIAKLFQDGAVLETELTQLSGRALSLDYASPEQIVGAPITIATDIYSLGVMLYEVLSGQSPYRLARRSRAALEEAILESDPVPLGKAIVEESAAAARGASVMGITRSLRADLDTIVMKALRKPPAERYATVDALGEDLAHWLRNEPILARRDRLGYRAAKFVRRHRVALSVTGAFVLALMG
ncbi:MAG: serine/threonine-protein kinase, partial [Steroidobacteraceae bacterium]